MKKLIIMISLLIFTHSLNANEKSGVESLSPQLRTYLSEEMLAIQKGMKDIFSYTISGQYDDIATLATKIKNSFILKKSLTKAQANELKTKLPKDFLIQDQAFHELAGKLAQAAEFDGPQEITQAINTMTNSCVKCHSIYAKSRFTSFE